MILTVCPSPCIDCTIELEKFNVGMLNRIENKVERWAGKALNTAVGIKRLGKEVAVSGFNFDTGGRRCASYLEREGISCRFVWNRGRLRVNYKIIDAKSMMTEINDRGDRVGEEKQNELLPIISELSASADVCVISGSLPRGVDCGYYKKMVAAVNPRAKVVVDCEKENMFAALSEGVYLVKPNLYELESATGETYHGVAEMLAGCKKLLDLGAEQVLLSLGKQGALITDGSKSYYAKTENVAVNSTVGAGDSMLAAVCVAVSEGAGMRDALRSGVAAGTAAITTPAGDLFHKDKYEEIYSKIKTIAL